MHFCLFACLTIINEVLFFRSVFPVSRKTVNQIRLHQSLIVRIIFWNESVADIIVHHNVNQIPLVLQRCWNNLPFYLLMNDSYNLKIRQGKKKRDRFIIKGEMTCSPLSIVSYSSSSNMFFADAPSTTRGYYLTINSSMFLLISLVTIYFNHLLVSPLPTTSYCFCFVTHIACMI